MAVVLSLLSASAIAQGIREWRHRFRKLHLRERRSRSGVMQEDLAWLYSRNKGCP